MFIFFPCRPLMHLSHLVEKSKKSFVLYLWGVLAFTYLRDLIFLLSGLALDSGRKVLSQILFNQRQRKMSSAKGGLYSTRNFMTLKIHVTEEESSQLLSWNYKTG